MAERATCPNGTVKPGALHMGLSGIGVADDQPLQNSLAIAARQRDVIPTAIDLFGPQPCLGESNVPADRGALAYRTLWNVFQRLTADFAAGERALLFAGTARRVYRMQA